MPSSSISALESIYQSLQKRGCISQVTPNFISGISRFKLSPNSTSRSPPSVYAGFDPTAPSLHLGHASVIAMLVRMQRSFGLRPVALIGSTTARIGDPSGRSATALDRPKLSSDIVTANAAGIKKNLERVFDFSQSTISCAQPSHSPLLVDNKSFYESISVVDFFSDFGRHFRLSSMLNKESVKSRLGVMVTNNNKDEVNDDKNMNLHTTTTSTIPTSTQTIQNNVVSNNNTSGMSFAEFSYQVFQSSDFLHLYQRENCVLQIGGADQWGNITAGIELIRRMQTIDSTISSLSTSTSTTSISSDVLVGAHGLTVPLLTTSSGTKFGKSEGNAIWLSESLTSNHTFFQFLLRTSDADVGTLLRQLTLLPDESIDAILIEHVKTPELKKAQLVLAESLTNLYRGSEAVASAKKSSAILYGGTGIWNSLDKTTSQDESLTKENESINVDLNTTKTSNDFLPQRALFASIKASDLLDLGNSNDIPMITLSMDNFRKSTIPSLCLITGAVKSISEGKRAILNGGIYLNWKRVVNDRKEDGFSQKDLIENQVCVLGFGKKKTFLIKIS